MTALIAHLSLRGRHHRSVAIGGLHWRYCTHRSHRLRLPCWRWHVYGGQCGKHNTTCWSACPKEAGDADS